MIPQKTGTPQGPITALPVPDRAAICAFFEQLYPGVDDGYMVLSSPDPTRLTPQGKPTLVSAWQNHHTTGWPTIATRAATKASTADLFFGVVLQHPDSKPNPLRRSTNSGAYIVPALWFDLDLSSGRHAASALPQTDAEGLDFLAALPAAPNLIVHTGGGLHAYWLLKEPYVIASAAEHAEIAQLSERFTRTLCTMGKDHGWTLDALGDLARVLRPPGTINHKYGKLVELIHESGARYNPSDFDWLLDARRPAAATHGGAVIPGQPNLAVIAEHYGAVLEAKSSTELAGAHPQHGSSTGDNFNVNVAKGLWHCWRHGTGGDALSLIAVCEGVLECDQAVSGALSGAMFGRVVDIANATFQASIVLGQGARLGAAAASRVPPQPILTTLTDVQEGPVGWLWWPYLAKGTLAMLDGDPGLGKSWVSIQLAACLSRGFPLPDQQGCPTLPTGGAQHVLLITAEDSPEHTIKPRLLQADGDPAYVHILNGWTDPAAKDPTELQAFTLAHVPILEEALRRYPAALVVIDPLQAYLGKIDMHRSNETRPLMARLADLARKHNTVILCIRHPSKPGQGGGRAIHRGLGSIDFIGIARTGLNLLPHPVDQNKGLLAQGKNNLGLLGRTLIFSKAEGQFTWAGVSRLGADLLASTGYGPGTDRLVEACFWLEEKLGGGIPQPAKDLEEQLKDDGIKWDTAKRAKKALGIKSIRQGGVKNAPWDWSLPGLSLSLPPLQSLQLLQPLQPLQPLQQNQYVNGNLAVSALSAPEVGEERVVGEVSVVAVVAEVVIGAVCVHPPTTGGTGGTGFTGFTGFTGVCDPVTSPASVETPDDPDTPDTPVDPENPVSPVVIEAVCPHTFMPMVDGRRCIRCNVLQADREVFIP